MSVPNAADAPRFPLFVKLFGVRAVVFGGGPVAVRRANVMADFGADVTVIAPEISSGPLKAAVHRRPYAPGDCAGFGMALAATDSREVNHAIFLEARGAGIPVNVSDAPEECDFFFPAVARRDSVVIGVTASGTDHRLAKETAHRIRERLDELCGKGNADAKT